MDALPENGAAPYLFVQRERERHVVYVFFFIVVRYFLNAASLTGRPSSRLVRLAGWVVTSARRESFLSLRQTSTGVVVLLDCPKSTETP